MWQTTTRAYLEISSIAYFHQRRRSLKKRPAATDNDHDAAARQRQTTSENLFWSTSQSPEFVAAYAHLSEGGRASTPPDYQLGRDLLIRTVAMVNYVEGLFGE